MPHPGDWEIVGRLVLAMLLGGLIGMERELNDHPAGLRTHMSVALGAALFTIAGSYGFEPFVDARNNTNVNIGVERVASNIVTGVGFLGGGAILKYGATVKGLTTAASLWVTAAIGMAAGVGAYLSTIVTTVALLVALVGFRAPRSWLVRRYAKSRETVVIRVAPGHESSAVVAALNEMEDIGIRSLSVKEQEGGWLVTADVTGSSGQELEALLAPLADREEVESLDVS
ncbi:MAG TPA: MgtC/SapB family protein [Acidimicrobiales bacterium]|nr:MgtC/SapB family protein [Acidimicrobiales bacterium]